MKKIEVTFIKLQKLHLGQPIPHLAKQIIETNDINIKLTPPEGWGIAAITEIWDNLTLIPEKNGSTGKN